MEQSIGKKRGSQGAQLRVAVQFGSVLLALTFTGGCGTGSPAKQNQGFFTSGSREADQRADQRMAQHEQLAGTGEGAGEKKSSKTKKEEGGSGSNKVETKRTLFDRLGAEQGITAIVEDFIPRALQDPRVNWERKGLVRAGLFHKSQPAMWQANPTNIAMLKKHIVQFLALTTGGPAKYEGKEMKSAHAGMHIANPEFDAAIGDLKASLDKLQIPNTEQKELLAIVESTRAQIVTER